MEDCYHAAAFALPGQDLREGPEALTEFLARCFVACLTLRLVAPLVLTVLVALSTQLTGFQGYMEAWVEQLCVNVNLQNPGDSSEDL